MEKVYLVYYYDDCAEDVFNVGIYSTMEKAMQIRDICGKYIGRKDCCSITDYEIDKISSGIEYSLLGELYRNGISEEELKILLE